MSSSTFFGARGWARSDLRGGPPKNVQERRGRSQLVGARRGDSSPCLRASTRNRNEVEGFRRDRRSWSEAIAKRKSLLDLPISSILRELTPLLLVTSSEARANADNVIDVYLKAGRYPSNYYIVTRGEYDIVSWPSLKDELR